MDGEGGREGVCQVADPALQSQCKVGKCVLVSFNSAQNVTYFLHQQQQLRQKQQYGYVSVCVRFFPLRVSLSVCMYV